MPSLFINLVVFIVICLIVNNLNVRRVDKDNIITVFAVFQVIFFQTFKDVNTLPDIPGYVSAYRYICGDEATYLRATSYYKMQYGYYLYNKILSVVSDNPYYFTFATGCLTSLPYVFFIRKYSPLVGVSLMLYMMSFLQSTFVLRQYTAVGICIISFHLLLRRKFVWSILLWLVSLTIHPTALFFCIVYALYFIHGKKMLTIFYVVLFGILYKVFPLLMTIFADNIGGYESYLDAGIAEYTTFLIYFFMYGMGCVFLVKNINSDDKLMLMIKMLGVAVIIPFAATFSGSSNVVPRLLQYVTFVQFVVIAETLLAVKSKPVKYITFILYVFIFFYQFYISDKSYIFDFKLIFE